MCPAGKVCGRLAPSPTGHLHLGNAWSFLLAWLAARKQNGTLILRLEDIDSQRSRAEFASALQDDLRWLGIDWDNAPNRPYKQSERGHFYEDALNKLSAADMTYPCFCSRKELRSLASAPHIDDTGAPYPGTCRSLSKTQQENFFCTGRKHAIRLRCPDVPVTFHDAVMGAQRHRLSDCGGDFALKRSDGVTAYQLATAVDDGLMHITQIVRGCDLLLSTPRQIALLNLLGYTVPSYAHIPLLLDNEGQRLAKRHQSLTLRALRHDGASNRRIVGLLGRLAGINPDGRPCYPQDLLQDFTLTRLPKANIRITAEDLRNLTV